MNRPNDPYYIQTASWLGQNLIYYLQFFLQFGMRRVRPLLYIFFDHFSLQNPESQYIYPEGATGQRGMWEKSFSIIGYSVLSGTTSSSSEAKLVGDSICFLPGYLKKVHQILREDVFPFCRWIIRSYEWIIQIQERIIIKSGRRYVLTL